MGVCRGCKRINIHYATKAEMADPTALFCFCEPKVSMYEPIPKEMLRNLPPWVGKLQTFAYWLMVPYALALVWVLWLWPLAERIGLW